MNLKIVMVEGPHDGAFISKVLQVNGYKTCTKHIKDYTPKYISNYLIGQFKNAPVDQLNLQAVRQHILFPSYSLINENDMILIFQMGGDSRKDHRHKLTSDISRFLWSQITSNDLSKEDLVTFIYELDADEKGVEVRIKEINAEIKAVDENFIGISSNGSYVYSRGIRWGAYVFSDNRGKGKLEDVILPMMEADNEDIARCAREFVDKRNDFSLFRKEKSTRHPQKARVGVMGQLQKAGSANPAIIEQSSYITADKIKLSDVCNQLYKFLSV